jgi:hypothetical protein
MSRLLSILLLLLTSCMKNDSFAPVSNTGEILNEGRSGNEGYIHITTNDSVHHIVNHPAFKDFGEHILPWDDSPEKRVGKLLQNDKTG